jgi:hypothetical protein
MTPVKTNRTSEYSMELPLHSQDLQSSNEEDINYVSPVYPKAYVGDRV